MHNQELLFRMNHDLPAAHEQTDALRFEEDWIADLLGSSGSEVRTIHDFSAFKTAVQELIDEDNASPSADSKYIADRATLESFKSIVCDYAVDGLTEAQAMFQIVPKLDPLSQAPVMRILIDEFGCGNPAKVHSTLYRNLLRELNLPVDVESFIAGRDDASFAFVNIYHWLTRRAPSVDYYLGALAYTETTIPRSFQCFQTACERLGIRSSDYFSEHIHIDVYHSRDAYVALQAREKAAGVDYAKAWAGATMARRVGNAAFAKSVEKARAYHD